MDLKTSVAELPAVRGAVAKGLERLGIRTVRDLLFHFPRRHEDRRALCAVKDVKPGTRIVVRGVLKDVDVEQGFRRFRSGARSVVVTRARLSDSTGELPVVWFHQRYLAQQYPSGTSVYLVGGVSTEGELVSPEIERDRNGRPPLHVARLVPVYPETAGVRSRMLRYLVSRVLPLAGDLREYLPERTRAAEGLWDFSSAVAQMHLPDDDASLARARERLSFDELLLPQLAALKRRAARQAETALPLAVSREAIRSVSEKLPFRLTSSQSAAVDAILRDCAQAVPMTRLLAGDVGSGKTVVAGLAAFAVSLVGGQAVFLAPTEILAQQHAETLVELFGAVAGFAGLRITLLTASTKTTERTHIGALAADGAVDLVVGTHALLHAALRFTKLVLVIVDEQHRFGVLQRGELTQRGPSGTTPHFLSLSATPIPRTLQLTAYGDVEISPLDPRPGQRPIQTELVTPAERNTMYATLKNRIAAGGQVFVVCPRVADIPEDDRRSVEAEYRRLKQELFGEFRLGRLHGKLTAPEKTRVLEAFRRHAVDLLVASTVVEVGVDIPDADTLLIEGAEHFGLATLHQLRGRVGRRGQDARCFLATESEESAALERLRILVRTNDGLTIAEEDLRRRGPGDTYGTRQHGGINLKIASLADLRFLLRVRAAAERLLQDDGEMRSSPLLAVRVRQLNVTTHFE